MLPHQTSPRSEANKTTKTHFEDDLCNRAWSLQGILSKGSFFFFFLGSPVGKGKNPAAWEDVTERGSILNFLKSYFYITET